MCQVGNQPDVLSGKKAVMSFDANDCDILIRALRLLKHDTLDHQRDNVYPIAFMLRRVEFMNPRKQV